MGPIEGMKRVYNYQVPTKLYVGTKPFKYKGLGRVNYKKSNNIHRKLNLHWLIQNKFI